jgi:hypothetical protein
MWKAVTFDAAAQARIDKATALERESRLLSYLDRPTDLGYATVRPITPRDCIIFELSDNALFSERNSKPTIEDALLMAWQLKLQPEKEYKFSKRATQLFELDPWAMDKTREFVGLTFVDLPKLGNQGEQLAANTGTWLPGLIDTVASEYGWGEDKILDTPVKVLFLQMQQIYKRLMPTKYRGSNPLTQQARAKEMQRIKEGIT